MQKLKKKYTHRNILCFCLCLTFILFTCAWCFTRFHHTANKEINESIQGTIVVSARSDPYFSLAQNIAREENLELIEEFSDILRYHPKFIILVASPANLDAERLAAIGRLYQENDYYPALGIITGSTLDSAQGLWERRNQVKEGNNYLAGDVDILQMVYEPTIFEISDPAIKTIELNQTNLIDSLKHADYFYWTRHTGPKDWAWNEETGSWTENDQLLAGDIPALKPAVIYSLTCSSFHPWLEDSMPLGFVDQGAAAFLGFVNTPHTTGFIKHGRYVPGLTSWSEFPLGLIAQVQNKVAAEYVFNSPQLFMLGDPRVHISAEQPYQILSDSMVENEIRIIEGVSEEKGILSVRIKEGATYGFLSVKGLTSIGKNDVFFNNKLQALDLGADKYVLFLHDGGNFKFELKKQTPPMWHVRDALSDAFDFSWAVFWLNRYIDSSPPIYPFAIVLFTAVLLFKIIKQKRQLREYKKIFLFAFLIVLIRLAYFLLRCDKYTVSTAMVDYSTFQLFIGYLGVFSCISTGLIIMLDSKKWPMKVIGLILSVLRQFWLAGFSLIFITLINIVTPITRNTENWLLRYDSFWLSSIVLFIDVILVVLIYHFINSKYQDNEIQ